MKNLIPFAIVCLLLLACSTKEQVPQQRPNIIFLLTDDQRWDAMGAMGNPIIQTPEMDKLARQGIMFRNAYVTTSICAVSRASILSGQYMRRHGVADFGTFFSPEAWQNTYPMLMRKAGYYTGFIGKFGVGRKETMPAEDFDYWQGIPGQPWYEQEDENGNYKHLTSILGDQSLEFLKGAPKDKPFCLSVSFKAPHVQDSDPRQFLYDSAYIDLFANTEMPLPETADPKYWNQFPDFFRTDTNEARRRWRMRFETPELFQASVKGYYRLIYGVDVVIGRMRKKLEEIGQNENTIIVLMGDNGFYLSEHGLAGKWYGHEESIRVPLVIYDPRRPANKRGLEPQQLALNIDIAPTLLAYAGIDPPAAAQGRNLLDVVDGKTSDWRSDFYYEHLFGYRGKIPQVEGVVSDSWKYMRFIQPDPPYEELYDIPNDPKEKMNLASDPQHSAMLEKMRSRYEELKKEVE